MCRCAASDPHATHKKRLSSLIEAGTDKRKALWQNPLGRQLKLLLPAKPGFVSHGRGPVTVLLSHSLRSDSQGLLSSAELCSEARETWINNLFTCLVGGESSPQSIREDANAGGCL